jgi:hypothetical protein
MRIRPLQSWFSKRVPGLMQADVSARVGRIDPGMSDRRTSANPPKILCERAMSDL